MILGIPTNDYAHQQEHAARVAMISSIARSQEALAGILENIAEVSAHSDVTARKLAENIRLLTGYQSVMTEMIAGIPLNRTKRGILLPLAFGRRIAGHGTAKQEQSKHLGG